MKINRECFWFFNHALIKQQPPSNWSLIQLFRVIGWCSFLFFSFFSTTKQREFDTSKKKTHTHTTGHSTQNSSTYKYGYRPGERLRCRPRRRRIEIPELHCGCRDRTSRIFCRSHRRARSNRSHSSLSLNTLLWLSLSKTGPCWKGEV